MGNPINFIKTGTRCDLVTETNYAMGDHKEFIEKAIKNENYEWVAAMKEVYDEYDVEFPVKEQL